MLFSYLQKRKMLNVVSVWEWYKLVSKEILLLTDSERVTRVKIEKSTQIGIGKVIEILNL